MMQKIRGIIMMMRLEMQRVHSHLLVMQRMQTIIDDNNNDDNDYVSAS